MTQQPNGPVPIGPYAAGLFTEVLEVQAPGTVEQIVVHTGVPMGPRGFPGPVGPAGPAGRSTEWHTGYGAPETKITDEEGDLYLDIRTGDLWEFRRNSVAGDTLEWTLIGNLMGPAGASGTPGPPAIMEITEYASSEPDGDGAVFMTTGPSGPPYWEMQFYLPRGPSGPPGATGTTGATGATGAMGPPGTQIFLEGSLGNPGPPSATNPPNGAAANPSPGDGWVASNGDVWVWTPQGWVNVGRAVGPVGPTGPPPIAYEYPLTLVDAGDRSAYQVITHPSTNPYPSVRVLIEDPVNGYYDTQTASVFYPSQTEIRIVMDNTAIVLTGKVIVT